MRIESLQRNVSYSSSKSLVGQYFRVFQNGDSKSGAISSGSLQLATPQDLKSQLLNVANKLKVFRDSDAILRPEDLQTSNINLPSATEESDETTSPDAPDQPPAEPSETSNRIGYSFQNSNKPVKFGRHLLRSFQRGTSSEDDELLKNKNLSGDVQFRIGEGENETSFSIHVDSDTTARDFVNEFNAKAGGRAAASLVDTSSSDGDSKFRIKIEATASVPVPAEEGADPSPPPVTDSEFLGSGSLNISKLQGNSDEAVKGLKSFVDAFNKLVRYARDGNGDGDILASTGVDERAIDAIRDEIVNAKSENGSVAFSQFVNEKGNGELQFNPREFERLFLEDPEGTGEALHNLATAVSGSDGLVRDFVQSGALVDQAFQSVDVQAAQLAIKELDDRSISSLQDVRDLSERSNNVVSALEEKVGFLQGLKR